MACHLEKKLLHENFLPRKRLSILENVAAVKVAHFVEDGEQQMSQHVVVEKVFLIANLAKRQLSIHYHGVAFGRGKLHKGVRTHIEEKVGHVAQFHKLFL